jgi:16S rRNA (guanine527-N7)-methyltransferase
MSQSQIALFRDALRSSASMYDVQLSKETEQTLADYYELLLRWNERLHLVAPCPPKDFATMHVLESLVATNLLTEGAHVIDVGSGAGLPIIPCLIARPDIQATVIESSQKKSVFLREALKAIGALKRATIVTKPFEEASAPNADFLTCRALDGFASKLPALIQWAPTDSTLLLFGGENLRQQLLTLKCGFDESLLPASERRFLFQVKTRN